MESQGLILGLVFSIMFNVLIIAGLLVTGIGQDVLRRFKTKQKIKRGGHVLTLFIKKDGSMKDICVPVSEGKFKVDDKPYVRNPRLLLNFRSIPSYLHLEDQSAPINIWGKDYESDLMSASEMDKVMVAQSNFDLKEFLQKYLPFIMIGAFILVAVIGALAYFDFATFQMLRDGTFQAVQVVPSKIVSNFTGV